MFDLIFMFQHYVLYRDKWANKDKMDDRAEKISLVNSKLKELSGGKEDFRFGSSDPA